MRKIVVLACVLVALAVMWTVRQRAPESDLADEVASQPAPVAPGSTGDRLYVASQSGPAATVIDMDSFTKLATIDLTELGFSANAKPHHAAVEPDGSFWYLSLIADGRVLKFDRDNNLVGQVEFETPGLLAVDPVQDLLWVGRSMAAVNPPQRVGVIDRESLAIEELDVFLPRPHAIVAAAAGGRVYTASLAENRIATLQATEDDLELTSVDGPMHMFVNFALSPDGGTLVTGGQMSGQVLVFDLADPAAPELVHTLDVGGQPWHPVWAPDGSRVYVPQNVADSVAVVNTGDWTLERTFTGGGLSEPHGSAISADGRYLFVSGRNTKGGYPTEGTWHDGSPMGTVVKIDTQSGEVVGVIEVPPYAAGMGARIRR